MTIVVRPDYFQGTCYFESYLDLEACLDLICDLLPIGDSWSFLNKSLFCGESFNYSFRSIRGKLYGGFRREHQQFKMLLQVPGSYWSQLDPSQYLSFLDFMLDCGFHPTRFDIALDDFDRRTNFNSVKKLGKLGHYRLVNSYKCIESAIVRGADLIPTCYFGSSNKMLRFYDAEVVHGIKADRWELQLRDNHARTVINDYLENSESLASFVTGAVDFGYCSSNDYDSFKRVDWWESLRTTSKGARKINLPDYEPCFEKSESWLYNQVSPTLAVAFHGYGIKGFSSFLFDLITEGTKRLKSYHIQWINELKKEFQPNG
jgi:hypothetical protein